MRNAFILLFLLIIHAPTFAQSFNLKAGLNLSKMYLHDNGITYSNDFAMKPGFYAGIIYDMEFSNMLSTETGLILSTKGYRNNVVLDNNGAKESSTQTLNLFYIIIPYTAKVYFGKGCIKIFGLLGPYLGMGVAGTNQIEQNLGGKQSSSNTKIKWGSKNEGDLRRLDFGLTVGAGIKFKSVELGLSYDYGLSNLTAVNLNLSGNDVENRVLGISILFPIYKIQKPAE